MNFQKLIFPLLLLIFIFLYFSVPAIHAITVPKFNILAEDWEPYSFQEDGVVKGISTDMLVLMLEKVGSSQGRNDIKIYPWARAYQMIQQNSGTLLFTTTRTRERKNLFKWVGPIFEIEYFIYALKSRNIKINSYEDLRKYKIGTLRGDVVEELLVKNTGMKTSDFEQVSSNIHNTRKLFFGRIDLIPQSKVTTIHTCKEAGFNPDDFEPVFSLGKKNMYYAFHKETPDSVIVVFQEAFNDIKSDGKLDEIFKKFLQ
jgi:polar amino acid transport system substrate-binding protein